MKKLLSIILAIAMIMSLFCVVPASAANATVEFPYVLVDFEDGNTVFKEGNNPVFDLEIVDSGVAARGKVQKCVVSGSTNGGPGTSLPSATIGIGDKITLSAWIKSEQVLKSANLSLIFYPAEVEGTTGATYSYTSWVLPFDKDNTDWQYVTTTITSDWEGTTGAFSYRWGTTGGLNFSAADKAADPEAGTEAVINDRTYYIDDFAIKVEKADAVTRKEYDYAEVVSLAATDGSSWDDIQVLQDGSSDTQTVATETVDGVENTFLRHTHSAAAPIWYGIKLREPMKAGHTYVLTFRNRVRGLPLQDGTLDPAGPSGGTGFNYVNYQTDIPYDGSVWTGSGSNGSYESWSVHSAATRKTGKGPYADIRWNAGSATAYHDWHNVSITYASTKQNIEENMSNVDYIRIGAWLYNGAGTNLGTFDFDDFKVIDLGPLTNGGFENANAAKGAGIHDGSNSSQWVGGKIGGWHTPNPHGTTQALQGGSRLSTEQTADKYGALYYQNTAAAEIYQYVPVYAGEKYHIKGYVRGANSNGAYTQGRARLVADFSGDTLDQEVYNVKALGTNGVIYGDWVEFGNSYNMNAPLTIDIDLTNIGLIEGKTETAGIMPKSPKLSIQFDESWEGNVNAPNTADHAVYMDGFKLTRIASNGTPTVVANSASMDSNGIVTADYTYTTEGNVAEATDDSVYRLVANGKYYGTFYDKNAIVVPEAARAVEGLSLEILPISATGYFGDAVTVAIEAVPSIEGTTLTQADGSVTVATETAITGAKIIFVTYDATGKMVDWEAADVTLGAQGTQVYAPVDLTAGSYTRAMLWQDMVECIPLADMIQY